MCNLDKQKLSKITFLILIRGAWDSQAHIEQGIDILIRSINCVRRNHPTWTIHQATKGGISGYDVGCENIKKYDGMYY